MSSSFFLLTKKREVAEEGGEQVHDKHGQDGDVGHVLHALLGSTGVERNQYGEADDVRSDQEARCQGMDSPWRRTLSAPCRWAAPLGGRQRRTPGLGWCRLSKGQTHQRSAGRPAAATQLGACFVRQHHC